MALGQPLVWPSTKGRPARQWLWSRQTDLLLVAGGGSFLFAAVAVPASKVWEPIGPALVPLFVHLGAVVNYPHYAATYEIAVRERHRQPRGYRWLIATTPIMLALAGAALLWPEQLVVPLVNVYLTWSAYHYAAQHFGIASMYSAREGRPLLDREKLPLQASFIGVAVYMLISLNMMHAEAMFGAPPGYRLSSVAFSRQLYPLALVLLAACAAAFALAQVRLRARTGRGFSRAVWALALTNVLWFVVPNIWLPGATEPWLGQAVAIWVPLAVPFFHCAQYLAVTADRARSEQPLRPVVWMASLVALGLVLFEVTAWGLPRITSISPAHAVLIVTAVINIHHFVIDGAIWKRPKRLHTLRAS